MARTILGERPEKAVFAFDPGGSYVHTYAVQGADRAFAVALMDRQLTDDSFFTALSDASQQGLDIQFETRPLARPDHPNSIEMELVTSNGAALHMEARSIGGGEVEITRIAGLPVLFNGAAYELAALVSHEHLQTAIGLLEKDRALLAPVGQQSHDGHVLLTAQRRAPLRDDCLQRLKGLAVHQHVYQSAPVYFVHTGEPMLVSTADILRIASDRGWSLGQVALAYESQLLDLDADDVMQEALRRYDIMQAAAEQGLQPDFAGTQLVTPTASEVFRAEGEGRLTFRGPHTRAAARSMAVMHVDGAMGVVCAAPTGGSAGVIPGALVTLVEERKLDRQQIGLALLASGLIGVIVAQRATFAAEVCGCQVEIGAAGAMAGAAVVDALGGSADQAAHAAAISFQNTMGLVCDLVQGMVEIPCTTRNAVAAANAFINADLILGGYVNPIPLDETIDAVYAVGRAMPKELLCTSQGGLAVTPSALALQPGCCGKSCGTSCTR
jgi:L-serine dehydratase